MPEVMNQSAPYPEILADLVSKVTYKPGWQFHLIDLDRGQGSIGLTLDIITCTSNSYHPTICETCRSVVTSYRVHHYMTVPPAAFDRRSWRRWLFDQIVLVETHEAMEFFQIGDERPVAPSHGPGNNPYLIREVGTEEDRRMSFRGEMNPA